MHLAQLLARANEADANAFDMTAGRPLSLRTQGGSVELESEVDEHAILAMLENSLGEDQQVELAIGNPVTLSVDTTRGVWTLLAESFGEGLGVSGKLSPGARTLMPRRTGNFPRIDLEDLEDLDDDDEIAPPDSSALRVVSDDSGPIPPPPSSWERDGDVSEPLRVPMGSGSSPTPPLASSVQSVSIKDADLALHVVRGSVVFSLTPDEGEFFAMQLGAKMRVVVDDDVDGAGNVALDPDIDEGVCVIVRCENPSLAFGWLLRRAEAGARVIIETNSKTAAGARRVFVGLHGAPAERWLDALPNFVFANGRLTNL